MFLAFRASPNTPDQQIEKVFCVLHYLFGFLFLLRFFPFAHDPPTPIPTLSFSCVYIVQTHAYCYFLPQVCSSPDLVSFICLNQLYLLILQYHILRFFLGLCCQSAQLRVFFLMIRTLDRVPDFPVPQLDPEIVQALPK